MTFGASSIDEADLGRDDVGTFTFLVRARLGREPTPAPTKVNSVGRRPRRYGLVKDGTSAEGRCGRSGERIFGAGPWTFTTSSIWLDASTGHILVHVVVGRRTGLEPCIYIRPCDRRGVPLPRSKRVTEMIVRAGLTNLVIIPSSDSLGQIT